MFTRTLHDHDRAARPTTYCGVVLRTATEVTAHELACLDCRAFASIFADEAPAEITADQITDGMALRVSQTGTFGFSMAWVLPETHIFDGVVASHGRDYVTFEPVDRVSITRWLDGDPFDVSIRLFDLNRRAS